MATECCYIPKRYILVCFAHLGFFVSFALRVNLSVALVAMVNDTQTDNTTTSVTGKANVFDWDESQQGILLSSFFYGYLFTQLPGGYLAHRLGGKWVFFMGVFLTCILSALTPLILVSMRYGFYMLLALRVLEGVAQGVTYPAMHSLLGKWTTNDDKGFVANVTYAGACTGTLAMLPVSSVLCELHFLNGWPAAFYIPALVGIVWCLFWGIFVCDSPETHSTISNEEKMLILVSRETTSTSNEVGPVPWACIFSSPPVWALVISYFCNSWVFSLILTDLPSYFKQVLKFSLEENGVLSALPYLSAFIATVVAGWMADWLTKKYFSVTTVRKLLTVASFYLTALCMVLVSFVGCDQVTLPVVYLVIATGVQAINTNFFNHLDLAPRYSDLLMGITNIFSTIAGCITPVVTGYFINNEPTQNEYMKVFLLAAGVSVLGGTLYAIFGSGELQEWNDGLPNKRMHVYLDDDDDDEGEEGVLNQVGDSERELLINC